MNDVAADIVEQEILQYFRMNPRAIIPVADLAERIHRDPLVVRRCVRKLKDQKRLYFCEAFGSSDVCYLDGPNIRSELDGRDDG